MLHRHWDFLRLLRLSFYAKRKEQSVKCKKKDFLAHDSVLVFAGLQSLTFDLCHLITLSALAKTFGGIVRPICFAAFRLMINSNFVGCSTGKSAGLTPLRILSTYAAARRNI